MWDRWQRYLYTWHARPTPRCWSHGRGLAVCPQQTVAQQAGGVQQQQHGLGAAVRSGSARHGWLARCGVRRGSDALLAGTGVQGSGAPAPAGLRPRRGSGVAVALVTRVMASFCRTAAPARARFMLLMTEAACQDVQASCPHMMSYRCASLQQAAASAAGAAIRQVVVRGRRAGATIASKSDV